MKAFYFKNKTKETLTVIVEPWAIELEIQPDSKVLLKDDFEEELDFEISEDEKALMRKRLAEAKEADFEDWDAIKDNFL